MKLCKSLCGVVLVVLAASGLSACSHQGADATSAEQQDVHKAIIGNEQTGNYAEKVATVQHGKTDPYTRSQDKANYVGKEPISSGQTPLDHQKDQPQKP